jgi:dynein heavy chain
MTYEPPRGIRASLLSSFANLDEQTFSKKNSRLWRRMIFSLFFFHAVVQERKKFGALGWNHPYEFNDSGITNAVSKVNFWQRSACFYETLGSSL